MAFWIPLALMAASAASKGIASHRTGRAMKGAQNQLQEGRRDNLRRTSENLGLLQRHATDTYGAGRAARWDKAAADTQGAREAELAAAGPQKAISSTTPMTAEQLAFSGKLTAEEGTRMHDVVRLLAKASAGQSAGFEEGKAGANFGSQYGSNLQDANNMLQSYGVDFSGNMQKAGQAGAGWNLIGDLFKTGAMMYGMGGAPGGASGAAPGEATYSFRGRF